MRYRNEIDGLRAIAVLPVIFFHAGFATFQGGFVGVDVFFVISGYLITSLILNKAEKNNFSLFDFYQRRARRILPALFLMMGVSIPFAWFLMDPFELKEFGQSIISTITFSSNVFFQLKSGYFNTANELKPLLHTWSLAVEEQYYIIFPFLITLIYRLGRKVLIWMLIVIAVLSLGFAQWAAYHSPSLGFYSLPTRMWEILCGSFIAVYFQKNNKIIQNNLLNQILGLIGLGLILYAVFCFDENTPFPSFYTLIPTIGTALIIIFAQPKTVIHRILSNRLLVGIGVISYSAYLWHQPIFSMLRIYTLDELSSAQLIVGILSTFLLAYLTKVTVEDYFRFTLPMPYIRKALLGFGIFAVALMTFGMASNMNMGFPSRTKLGLQLAQNFGLSEECSGASFDEEKCKTSEMPSTILWGDSYAMHIAQPLSIVFQKGMMQTTLSACPPIIGFSGGRRKSLTSCEKFNENVISLLEKNKNINTVVLSSSFDKFTPENQKMFTDTIQVLKKLDLDVYVVSPPPVYKKTLKCVKQMDRKKQSLANCNFEASKMNNKKTFETLTTITEETQAHFIDLRELMCAEGICHVEFDRTLMYRDNGHFSNASTQIVANFFKNKIIIK